MTFLRLINVIDITLREFVLVPIQLWEYGHVAKLYSWNFNLHYKDEQFEGKHFDEDLEAVKFENCRFIDCDFTRAKLSGAEFSGCAFTTSDGDKGCSFSFADIRDTSFRNCRLALASFRGADGFGAEFRDCDLKGADFRQASFANFITTKSYFCSVFITGCNLSYADFEGQLFEKCELTDNIWRGANLSGVSMDGADLSRGDFSSDSWGTFSLKNCDLRHVDLHGLDIRRMDITGVKICDWQQESLLSPLGLIVS